MSDQLFSEGFLKEGLVRFGIEKQVHFTKYIRPYAALDAMIEKSYSELTLVGGIIGKNEWHKTDNFGLGLFPALGIELLVTKNISISIETRYRLSYVWIIDKIDYLSDSAGFVTKNKAEFRMIYDKIGAIILNCFF
jgi:hypothetical protein